MGVSMTRLTHFILAVIWLSFAFAATAQTDGLAARPPMGWNSWNHFHRQVDDAIIRAQAEAMVSSGMRYSGYLYINFGDNWEGGREAKGKIQADSQMPEDKAAED